LRNWEGKFGCQANGEKAVPSHSIYLSMNRSIAMNKRILVIEDNEQNLYLITFILEKHCYQVLQAHDGRSGIDLAKKKNST
jgi:response regulator RpfG family c-di-GMP phosphodiesterase